jgi:predicted DNA-binding helix-hairpin-helix protein
MIVGATPTPDADILLTARHLYEQKRLRRVYYSAYSPIPHADTRLPAQTPPLVREHRLYQADWLMRFYGFRLDELVTPDRPNLDLEVDPKLAWALEHREQFPIDVNTASREMLLRIPGLGVKTVDKILRSRRHHRLRRQDLQKLRVPWSRVQHFVTTVDHKPKSAALESTGLARQLQTKPVRQLALFPES